MRYPLNIQYYGLLNGAPQLFQPSFQDFKDWILTQRFVQHDVETNVTKYVRERKIITVQFGSVNQKDGVQWVFQWSFLSEEEKAFIASVLQSRRWEKIIHNAAFEVIAWLNEGVRVREVYDTMLAERILWCGYSGQFKVSTALDATFWRRFEPYLKSEERYDFGDEQTNFGDNIITSSKLVYAATDVLHLDKIKQQQLLELHLHNLEFVAALENEAVIGFAQMMWEGMYLNQHKWLENLEWAKPKLEEAERKLDAWLQHEPFRSKAIQLGYINIEDKILINWNSNPQRQMVVEKIFPGCSGATKPVVTRWIKDGAPKELRQLATDFKDRKHESVEKYLVENHKEWLIEHEFFRPAGTCVINWNSQPQVLPLLQAVDKKLKDLSEESMGRFSHPIGIDLEHYKEWLKLVSSYGEKFLEHVDPDGCVRTVFGQIQSTGRISSSDPNMQQITVKEFVGQRYRNCFEPPAGYKFVSSDYVSQELAVIAFITQDKTWQDAIRNKQDLHSIASELVFKDNNNPFRISWRGAADRGCAYYEQVVDKTGKRVPARQKCKCPRHKVMRDGCKTLNFMLAYGGTEFRFAAVMRITVPAAKAQIVDYFKAMPAIGKTMTYLGRFGVKNGYIMTLAPFFRRRWFPMWEYRKRYIDEHIAGIRPDKYLGAIERASKNQPIQGSSADITKVAICMVMWELDEKNLHDKVKLVMQVHDQLDTVAVAEIAEQWKLRLTEIMEDAAKLIITNGLLKAETNVTDVWSK